MLLLIRDTGVTHVLHTLILESDAYSNLPLENPLSNWTTFLNLFSAITTFCCFPTSPFVHNFFIAPQFSVPISQLTKRTEAYFVQRTTYTVSLETRQLLQRNRRQEEGSKGLVTTTKFKAATWNLYKCNVSKNYIFQCKELTSAYERMRFVYGRRN